MTPAKKNPEKVAKRRQVEAVWNAVSTLEQAGLHPQITRMYHSGITCAALILPDMPALSRKTEEIDEDLSLIE